MSKGVFLISGICNHQGAHLIKSAFDNDTPFIMLHYFNWPRKHHTPIAAWRTWSKSLRTVCSESKFKLHTPLQQWTFDDNKYIESCKWFLS